jgi:potassium efflux system protein
MAGVETIRNFLEKLHNVYYSAPWLVAVTVAAILMLAAVPGSAAGLKGPVFRNVSTSTAPSTISLTEIALRATEVSDFLRDSAGTEVGSAEIESIRQLLPRFSRDIDTQYRQTMLILQGYSTLSGLQLQQQLWEQKQLRAKDWLQVLTIRAKQLDNVLGNLAGLQKTWAKTLEVGRASNAPEAILRQIETTTTTIAAARAPLQQQRSTLLDMQINLARNLVVCGNALQAIARVQQSVVKSTFLQDSPPLWNARQWVHTGETLVAYSREFANTIIATFDQYFSVSRLILSALLFAVVFTLFLYAHRRYRQWETTDKFRTFASDVFEHPFCASLTLTLLLLTSPISEVPYHSKALLQAISVVPMILLVRSTVDVRTFSGLRTLGILFAIDTVRQAFSGVKSVDQAILVSESIIAIAAIGLIMTRNGWSGSPSIEVHPLWHKLGRLILPVLLLYFAVSLVAAGTGYMNLARLLAPSVLVVGYLGLALYASVRVASGLIGLFLHMWPLKNLRIVQNCWDLLEKRLYHLLIWVAIFAWILRFLDYVGMLKPSISFVKEILGVKFEHGSIAISVGDALIFPFTVWIAYLLSAFLRFVLKEEVHPRLHVAPGVSYATLGLLHYFIILLGLFVGFGLMGFDLTRVSVLAGALGVGIGFGLQSIVNNLVSGLILFFERPVSAGDKIEVGALLGEVRKIGMRSSTVRTMQGADIIVPNSQLITEKVTNWTHSDQRWRIDLPLGVNYGAEPKKVMRLLEELASAHTDILRDPSPQCLFLGYGDSSINFELRAWTDKFDVWPRVRSDLAAAIYDAVIEAGMTFPFPQHDVHLVRDSGTGSAGGTVSGSDDKEGLEMKT